jgi:proline dehydrogenase
MARRFVAGETLDEALEAIRGINARGMTATLDHLGENVNSAVDAEDAGSEAVQSLRRVSQLGLRCNVSVKLTQFGLDLGDEVAYGHMSRLVEAASEFDNFVRIDMEGSEYTDRTLQIFRRLFSLHRNVGVVLQAALYRSATDLAELLTMRARVRLVKGAYLEPPSVAYARKEDVDSNYAHLTELLLAHGTYPAIATHDVAMIDHAKSFAAKNGIDRSSFEFQMLYGIRRDLQTQLVGEGYNVRIYVPYGSQWYPYLMRRMAERPANVMFVLGNIARETRSGSR